MFESIPEYRKVVFLMFLFKNDVDLLAECGYLKNDNNSLCLEFKKISLEQNKEYIDFIKIGKKTIIEKILNK